MKLKELVQLFVSTFDLRVLQPQAKNGLNIFGIECFTSSNKLIINEKDLNDDVKKFLADVRELGKNAVYFAPSSEDLSNGYSGKIFIGKPSASSMSDEKLEDICASI